MDSVEEFARQVSAKHPKIKILYNNAGIGGSKDENIITKDGFNIHMAVNYMGHFLLTNLLMKNLSAETGSRSNDIHTHSSVKFFHFLFTYRIISTISSFMMMEQLDLDDINMVKSGFGLTNGLPYCNSKYCLSLFTKELAKRSPVHSYAFCPGVVNTNITVRDVALILRLIYRITRSQLSVTAEEVNQSK